MLPEPETDILDEIKVRLNAATPGPWHKADSAYYGIVWSQETEPDPNDRAAQEPVAVQFEVAHTAKSEDAVFIAHAREDIATLLAIIEKTTENKGV